MQHVGWRWLCMMCMMCIVLGYLMGCERTRVSEQEPSTLRQIREAGTLVVLTRYAPTTYYIGREMPQGFEHDLVTAFAASLGVRVQFKVRDSIAAILDSIRNGEGDIAAAGLTRTARRETEFLFGPDYHTVQQQVVCHRESELPRQVEELVHVPLLVIAQSSYEERLQELQAELPGLQWDTTNDSDTEELLAQIWRKGLACTVADSNIVSINRRYFPELEVVFPLTDSQPLAWVLRPGSTDLQAALQRWFAEEAQDDLLVTLRDRYYSYVELFDYVDIKIFHRRIRTRLPRFRSVFEEAAQKYNLSWSLLAAQAYQESHWDAKAKSPTGVRGLMMLTRPTAASVGVRNRLDPMQSVLGGAKYLTRQLRRVPKQVLGNDRLWFALAAYNVGMGHLFDAMSLAKRFEKDPYVWRDVKTVLPLLAHRKYFKTLKYGYARGTEPVRYVTRIRNYQEILEKQP